MLRREAEFGLEHLDHENSIKKLLFYRFACFFHIFIVSLHSKRESLIKD